jgi:hypothetical protein
MGFRKPKLALGRYSIDSTFWRAKGEGAMKGLQGGLGFAVTMVAAIASAQQSSANGGGGGLGGALRGIGGGAPSTTAPLPNQSAKRDIIFRPVILNDDPRAIGGEVCRFLAPDDWKVEGVVEWDLRRTFNPAGARIRAASPDGQRSISTFPKMLFAWSPNPQAQAMFPRGSLYLGQEVQPTPADAVKAITDVVAPRVAAQLLKGARVVGKEDLPKLAEQTFEANGGQAAVPPGVKVTVRAARVRFEGGGLPAGRQADVIAVLGIVPMPALNMVSWGIEPIAVLQGRPDELDELLRQYAVMATSNRMNIAWLNVYDQVCEALKQNEKNASDAAVVRSRIIASAQRDISDSIRQRYENRQATLDRTNRAWSEAMRGVERWSVPGSAGGGSQVELPNGYRYAWRSADGRYLVTDGSGDPNQGSNTTWTRMSKAP